jgi:chromosome segregation ATPase
MNYTKQINEQNKKLELMENSLKLKDNQLSNLEKTIKDLSSKMENLRNENAQNNELIEKYKYQIETQIQQSEHNQTIYDNNFSTMSNRLEENKTKINELEEINNRLNGDINLLQKEIYSKNEIIENKNMLNKKLSNENKNISLMSKKINELEKNNKILNEENLNLKKYNNELIQENKKLNEKLNQVIQDINQKENNYSVEVYNINSKFNEVEKDLKNTLDELDKNKLDKNALIQNQEKYYNFVNEKLNEMNDFIIKAFNNASVNELAQLYKRINNVIENKYDQANEGDIKYELVENAILEMKKNLTKFILCIIEKNNKLRIEYNQVMKEKDMIQSQNNEIFNELKKYNQNQNLLGNKNKEMAFNYEKLKESYTKLYNDYNTFTNSNAKYVDDVHQLFLDLINQINKIFGINNNAESYDTPLEDVLKKKISLLIKEYEVLDLKLKENEKKDEVTYQKILEMEKLLDESHNVWKTLEEENQELKQEIERLNYRYNLLKASIDTVENQIKLGDF